MVAVLGKGLPFDLGSVGAGIAGVTVGMAVESHRRRKQHPEEAR
jgi:hypothetical protein